MSTVQLKAGEEVIGKVAGIARVLAASFIRPADTTAYASADLVADSTTAGAVAPLSWNAARIKCGTGVVRRARLKKSSPTTTNGSFRLHLYSQRPTVTNGDNGAWVSPHAGYLGSIDLDTTGTSGRAWSDSSGVQGSPAVGSEITFELPDGIQLFGLLEARAAYTPVASEVFTVELEVFQG